jgi:hypothetical protein
MEQKDDLGLFLLDKAKELKIRHGICSEPSALISVTNPRLPQWKKGGYLRRACWSHEQHNNSHSKRKQSARRECRVGESAVQAGSYLVAASSEITSFRDWVNPGHVHIVA